MGDGFVYVMGADELGNRVKIGWSDAPERRLRQLQTGSAYRLKLLDTHPGPQDLENFLHEGFATRRVHGEWFDFGDEDPLPLISEAVRGWSGASRGRPGAYAFDGPHAAIGVRQGRELASAASGLTDGEFRVLVWYWCATERSQGAVEQTQAEIAEELGMHPDAIGRATKVLLAAQLLIEAKRVGRTRFYRCTPRLAFVGSGSAHRKAVKEWGAPGTLVREPRDRRRPQSGK
jgi:DNA-binding transcriptional ArsR family regulator